MKIAKEHDKIMKRRSFLNNVTIFIAAFLFFSNICYSSVSYAATTNETILEKYISKLNELNNELGTTYAIPDKETHEAYGNDYESLINFYTSMTIEEFEFYIRNINDNNLNQVVNRNQEDFLLQQESFSVYAAPTTKVQTQKLIFSNSNYFYMKAQIYTGEGIRYTSIVEFGNSISVYPAYCCQSATYSFNSDYTTVDVSFKAGYYAAANLLYTTTPKYFYATFKAVGGDVYLLTDV